MLESKVQRGGMPLDKLVPPSQQPPNPHRHFPLSQLQTAFFFSTIFLSCQTQRNITKNASRAHLIPLQMGCQLLGPPENRVFQNTLPQKCQVHSCEPDGGWPFLSSRIHALVFLTHAHLSSHSFCVKFSFTSSIAGITFALDLLPKWSPSLSFSVDGGCCRIVTTLCDHNKRPGGGQGWHNRNNYGRRHQSLPRSIEHDRRKSLEGNVYINYSLHHVSSLSSEGS